MSALRPRLFISYSWEDRALAYEVEAKLAKNDTEIWVDHSQISSGDNLPKRISDALEWCNTLLLFWSSTAKVSRWVELEWTNAISLGKAIIPCKLDVTPLPAILSNRVYVDFSRPNEGIRELLNAIGIARQMNAKTSQSSLNSLAHIFHEQMNEMPIPQTKKPLEINSGSPHKVRVVASEDSQRNYFEISSSLSNDEVKKMFEAKDFFDRYKNWNGKGIENDYEIFQQSDVRVIVDHSTNLVWQQAGSSVVMDYNDALKYIKQLNSEHYGGFDRWRLPSLEEAMSLMKPGKNAVGMYIDRNFDSEQKWIWTRNVERFGAWVVGFKYGGCGYDHKPFDHHYVRAVAYVKK